jgi:hypothetical protein
MREDHFLGKPVVPFETLDERFPPGRLRALVAISDLKLNSLRSEKVKGATISASAVLNRNA